jgi:hypothetical protein
VSSDRDVTRIVRSWMDEGVTQLPDRVLDLVLDQLPATPQRRPSWLARRFPPMNTYARLGLVAAAVLAVVVVGLGLFFRSPAVGPQVSASPSFSASPAAGANPLVGTWLAAEVTCAQQVAAIEAAGYTAEQVIQAGADLVQELGPSALSPGSFFDPTCANGGTNQYSVVFDGLPAAATIRSATIYDHGAVVSPQSYGAPDGSTFEFGNHDGKAWGVCLTFHYAIVGDELTITSIDPSCPGAGDAPLLDQIALTAFFEAPFTRQP